MEKILTISIAAYNAEKYLDKCLKSCLGLTLDQDSLDSMDFEREHDEETISKGKACELTTELLNSLEIIIVNDGSTDGTMEIACRYKNMYPSIVKVIDKENGGYGSTINASLKVATGKFFKLLDADDWYDGTALVNVLKKLQDIDKDLVWMDFDLVNDEGDLLRRVEYPLKEGGYYDCASLPFWDFSFAMHGLAVKTELLKSSGAVMREKCFYTDSQFVFFCLAYAKTFAYVNENLYKYRQGVGGQSVSPVGMKKHFRDAIDVCKDMVLAMKEYDPLRQSILKKVCADSVDFAINSTLLACEDEKVYGDVRELVMFVKNNSPEVYELLHEKSVYKAMRVVGYRMKWLWIWNAKRKFM